MGHRIDYAAFEQTCPVCEQVCRDAVWLYQSLLLGPREDMDDIADAVAKIQKAWG